MSHCILCAWFVLYDLFKPRTVVATCLSVSVQLPEIEKGHIRYPCVCLLSLCGPKSWCRDLFCPLPEPLSRAPLLPTSQASPDPSLFSSFPSLGLIWYVQRCDKTKKREVFECTNTPFGGTPVEKSPLRKARTVQRGLGARAEENASSGGKNNNMPAWRWWFREVWRVEGVQKGTCLMRPLWRFTAMAAAKKRIRRKDVLPWLAFPGSQAGLVFSGRRRGGDCSADSTQGLAVCF